MIHLKSNKKSYTIGLLMTILLPIYSQVGINTTTPKSGTVLHIDGKNDTNGTSNSIDDVVIDNDGNVGLGTLTPKTKLDITGKLRLSDGSTTDFTDYILASDTNGRASWKDYLVALRYKTTSWRLDNTNWSTITNGSNVFTLTGTPTLTTESGATSTNSTLTIPKGRYLIFLAGDVAGRSEYGELRLMNGSNVVLKSPFLEELSGCATYAEFTTTVTLTFSFTIYDVHSNPLKQIPFLDTFPFEAPNNVWASVLLLGLDIGGE